MHCKLEFGDYVQTHEEHDNSMAARTIGAIALCPTRNTQGGYFFFSLTTGRVSNRGCWTSFPMPNEVIDRVHRMARQEHGSNGLLFEDRNHNPLVDPMMMVRMIPPTIPRRKTMTVMMITIMRMGMMMIQTHRITPMKNNQSITIPRTLSKMPIWPTKTTKKQSRITMRMLTKR